MFHQKRSRARSSVSKYGHPHQFVAICGEILDLSWCSARDLVREASGLMWGSCCVTHIHSRIDHHHIRIKLLGGVTAYRMMRWEVRVLSSLYLRELTVENIHRLFPLSFHITPSQANCALIIFYAPSFYSNFNQNKKKTFLAKVHAQLICGAHNFTKAKYWRSHPLHFACC